MHIMNARQTKEGPIGRLDFPFARKIPVVRSMMIWMTSPKKHAAPMKRHKRNGLICNAIKHKEKTIPRVMCSQYLTRVELSVTLIIKVSCKCHASVTH